MGKTRNTQQSPKNRPNKRNKTFLFPFSISFRVCVCVCVYVDFPRRRGATWDNLEGVFIQPSSVLECGRVLLQQNKKKRKKVDSQFLVLFYLQSASTEIGGKKVKRQQTGVRKKWEDYKTKTGQSRTHIGPEEKHPPSLLQSREEHSRDSRKKKSISQGVFVIRWSIR